MKKNRLFMVGLLLVVTAVCFAEEPKAVRPPAGFVGVWHCEFPDTYRELKAMNMRAFYILEIGENGTCFLGSKLFGPHTDAIQLIIRNTPQQKVPFTVDEVKSKSEIVAEGDSIKLVGQSLEMGGMLFTKGDREDPFK